MDEKDRALKLAEAALAASRGDVNAIGRAFVELEPNTLILAQAYAMCLVTPPFSQTEATRLVLNTLQFALAEKAARKLNVLTGWLIALTMLLAAFGIVDLVLKLRGHA
jgi:DUF917 family protein